jgi:hypothetical protein
MGLLHLNPGYKFSVKVQSGVQALLAKQAEPALQNTEELYWFIYLL